MVDCSFDRYRSLRAAIAVGIVALALGERSTCAEDIGKILSVDGQSGEPALPSKNAPPPRTRVASRQPLASGEAPLPPGLTNKTPNLGSLPTVRHPALPSMAGLTEKDTVVKVVIDPPLKHTAEHLVRKCIKTTADRPYDVRTVEDDVERLVKSKFFAPGSVNVDYQRVGEHGIIVTYHVVEFPTIKYLRFHGQVKVKERHLKKNSGLKEGDPLDPMTVKDAATKVEDYYHEKGYNKAKVRILEGLKKDDRGAVFLVNEGQKQRVSKVEFEGNTVASDGRLTTQIQSKPPILWLFKGEVDRQKIEEDVQRLYEYYRGLGYFRARINRELVWNQDQNWCTVRFIVDEGPRYQIRNISFVGHHLFTEQELKEKLKLRPGDYFDRPKFDKDKLAIEDKYGIKGYVFAQVQQDPIFSSDPDKFDQIDLVYQIEEGQRCVVSRVNVTITGDNPHTRRNTILNRVSLHPGETLSLRELRDSERRLKASSLFKTTPGDEPKIEFKSPDLADQDTGLAGRPAGPRGPGGFRGQSPDPPRQRTP
ncbi:MAG TPA: POTRA domain-containing protein [Pirellulales bacterium]|nr:POTRA domain-containing protein [Pirellulales bacterium]